MVQAGQADVQAHATFGKQLVVEGVELVSDVAAEHDRKDACDVALLGQQHVETTAPPRDVATLRLCRQGHLGAGLMSKVKVLRERVETFKVHQSISVS